MRMSAIVLFAGLLTSPVLAGYGQVDAARDIDPRRLGELFCRSRIAGDMAAVERYLAPKLVELLAEAASPRGRSSSSNAPAPTADPRIPWQSRPDRPTSCTVEIVNGFDKTIGVLVRIRYEAPGAQWSDMLNLERTETSWMLNNVFYDGGGNLRFRLFQDTAR